MYMLTIRCEIICN